MHNLKNVSLDIPRDSLVVFTGLSGSGKSSLAFDTIYAEGQRRYVESLSSYARMFLGQMDKPDVDYIGGLSPAISIDQKTTSKNPRSTVGTVTEIHDYLRLLYSRIGIPHCPVCGREIRQQTVDQIVDQILRNPERSRIQILAPVVRARKGEHTRLLEDFARQGYVRARIDGEIYELSELPKINKNQKHTIEIVVDRLVLREGIETRLTDSLETAMRLSGGLVVASVQDVGDTLFFQNYACPDCDVSIEELTPRMFSFNNPYGACPTCSGLGVLMKIDPALVIPDPSKSLNEGAIHVTGWNSGDSDSMLQMYLQAMAEKYDFSGSAHFGNPQGRAGQAALRHSGGKAEDFLQPGERLGHLCRALRGHCHQSGAALSGDQFRFHEGHVRNPHEPRPLPGMRRPAAEAGGAGRHHRGHEHRTIQRFVRFRRAAVSEGPAIDGKRGLHRPADSEGDRFPAAVSGGRGAFVPDPLPQRGHPFRRRGPAHPAGHTDRLLSGGGAVHSGRALHRPASAGQREAFEHAEKSAGSGQHPGGGGARRGHHAGGGLHRRRGPRRGGQRRRNRGRWHLQGDHEQPRLSYRRVSFRPAEGAHAGFPAEAHRMDRM